MTKKFFITATDTDAGKTLVSCALAYALTKNNFRVACFKPIAAGTELVNGQQLNTDVELMKQVANCNQNARQLNAILFDEPIAPHIAAQLHNKPLSMAQLLKYYEENLALAPDFLICEGAGGWRLPLGNNEFLSDFVQQTQQAVILVVNMKLGCLNHAKLTYDAIKADGLVCLGWVANCIEPMPYLTENINELKKILPIPLITQLPNVQDFKMASEYFDIDQLVKFSC